MSLQKGRKLNESPGAHSDNYGNYIWHVDVMIDVIKFSQVNCGFELSLTITLVVQVNRLPYVLE